MVASCDDAVWKEALLSVLALSSRFDGLRR